jgi:shikimate kinase
VKNSGFLSIDLDEQIESNEGKKITQIFAEEGEEIFGYLKKIYFISSLKVMIHL